MTFCKEDFTMFVDDIGERLWKFIQHSNFLFENKKAYKFKNLTLTVYVISCHFLQVLV